MTKDPIVQEVRRIRQEHAARFDYDLKAIFADLKRTEQARDQRESPLIAPREAQSGDVVPKAARHQVPTALSRRRR